MNNIGSKIGLFRLATITDYNSSSGIITITLDDSPQANLPRVYKLPIQSAWCGAGGEFIGGYPVKGSTVVVCQGQGGQWYIINQLKSNNTFDSPFATDDSTTMTALKPGRALMQVKGGQRLFIDPLSGIQAGSSHNFLHVNSKRKIISHNFNAEMSFTEAGRKINGVVRRDILENANRNLLGSTLDSQNYEDSLYTIPMDPSSASALLTSGNTIRNPPLVENRELTYEFANSFDFDTYQNEETKYSDPNKKIKGPRINRRKMRTDTLSLSQQYPNHLIETIKGTAVDTFGNILDINRSILPIGKINSLSLNKSEDKTDTFRHILAQLRKSIAYHFEINTKKGTQDPDIISPPDVSSASDYARSRSRFFIDIDKEGQFKINVPASSEIGNVPLLTRYENFSVLYSKQDPTSDPNLFLKEKDKKEIFLDDFGNGCITLSASDDSLDGYASPIDRFTDKTIKLGTAFHNIGQTCVEFSKDAPYLQAGVELINFDKENPLNETLLPLKNPIVTNNLIVSGPDANSGGRSGTINFDGFINLNIGANTVDRQSLWLDLSGAMISRIGRDKQSISWASSFDGDVLWQIGGAGIGNSKDSRFENENDAYKNGNLEIRILCNGQLMIVRAGRRSDGSIGIDLVSPGDMSFTCQQNMTFTSKSAIKFEAPDIVVHAGSTKRVINKIGGTI
jgi:hypothetical protein